MDHCVKMEIPSGTLPWYNRLRSRRQFENDQLEQLYRRYVFKIQQIAVMQGLCLFALLCFAQSVALYLFYGGPTIRALYFSVQFVLSLLLLLVVYRWNQNWKVFCVVTWITVLSFSSLLLIGLPLNFGLLTGLDPIFNFTCANGVWEVLLVVFMLYTVLPLGTSVCLCLGLLFPVLQLAAAGFLATLYREYLWQQVL